MIYLDNAATTKVYNEVQNVINRTNTDEYFNPSALYPAANTIKKKLSEARSVLAGSLGAETKNITFTSCATESNNWVFFNTKTTSKSNIVVSSGEHSSVYECCNVLKSRGIEVRFLPLKRNGQAELSKLGDYIDENTALVSLIHCSNETGAVNDIFEAARVAKSINSKLFFHSDGVQFFCKSKLELSKFSVDFYSISGHKIGAPKGIGALYIKSGINFRPYICGGGQENGLRSGTENTSGILGFSEAVKCTEMYRDNELIKEMNCFLKSYLTENVSDISINSYDCVPDILSVSFNNIKAEVLQRMLFSDGIIVGLGSACASKSRGNRVLGAMGLSKSFIEGTLRISFGVQNTMDEIRFTADKIIEKVLLLRGGKSE